MEDEWVMRVHDIRHWFEPPQPSTAGQRPERDTATGELIAYERLDEPEGDEAPCENGTPGCAIHHTGSSSCQLW